MRVFSLSLIRHAPTLYPEATLPPADPDIKNLEGHEDAIAGLVRALPSGADWWISPLVRCQQTEAALIKAGAKQGQRSDKPLLAEQNYGDWHGKPIADIWAELKNRPKHNWHFLHPDITPPNGESFTDLCQRLAPLFDDIKAHDGDLVILAHGMVIRSLIGHCLGWGASQALAIDISPLSLSQLTYGIDADNEGGRWMVNCLNRTF